MLLSATLIVRDEARHIGACLASIAGSVDEIIVVDTGSTDSTVEIARAAGATVVSRSWDGSFARARNAALRLARGQWILYIDADERLSEAGGLRAALAGSAAVAGLVRFRPGRSYTQYREYRLFRNRPDIRFYGRIHETMLPDVNRIVKAEGASIVDTGAAIEHLGYEGDQTAKHRRNLPLLRHQVENDPERLYLWLHLGAVHEGLGDAGAAEAAWGRGVAVARRQQPTPSFAPLIYANLALLRLRQGGEAGDLLAELRDGFPDDPFTAWVGAHHAMSRRRWDDAVALLRKLTLVDPDAVLHPVVAYDRRIFREFAFHGLGMCWFQLGDDAEAERWFGRAVEAAPDLDEYRHKRDLCRLRASRAAPGGGRRPRPLTAGAPDL